jgi:hypothetical protein
MLEQINRIVMDRIVNIRNVCLLGLAFFIGGSIGSAGGSSRAVNDTLILCNQRPHECKFKYDILMYEKEGRVPYVNPTKVKPQPTPEKK